VLDRAPLGSRVAAEGGRFLLLSVLMSKSGLKSEEISTLGTHHSLFSYSYFYWWFSDLGALLRKQFRAPRSPPIEKREKIREWNRCSGKERAVGMSGIYSIFQVFCIQEMHQQKTER